MSEWEFTTLTNEMVLRYGSIEGEGSVRRLDAASNSDKQMAT